MVTKIAVVGTSYAEGGTSSFMNRDIKVYASMVTATRKAIKSFSESDESPTGESILKLIRQEVNHDVGSCSVTYNEDLEQVIHVAWTDSNGLGDVLSMKVAAEKS